MLYYRIGLQQIIAYVVVYIDVNAGGTILTLSIVTPRTTLSLSYICFMNILSICLLVTHNAKPCSNEHIGKEFMEFRNND